MRRADPLILGGGPAGSAAAIRLIGAGVRATILERTREPGDALCGGFLSWRTIAALERLGISVDSLNRRRITRVRLFAGSRSAEARLPGPALAVSRRRLDALLLDRAAALGAGVERGVTVRDLDGTIARLDDGGTIGGEAVLLATGKHDLRGAVRDARTRDDPILGLRMRLAASPMIDDAIELHLFDGGYAGIVVQEDGRANLCLAVARSRLHAAGSPLALLQTLARENAALGARMDALDSSERIDAVANVPYGWRARTTTPGVYRLGDQAAVIPSLAGEGMGIAISSGVAAAAAMLSGRSSEAFQADFAQNVARPMAVAGLVRRLAERPPTADLLTMFGKMPWLVRAVARLTRINQSGVDEAAAASHIGPLWIT